VGAIALIAIGIPLLVLPGPGLLLISAGISLLAVDYPWAQRLLTRIRARLTAARRRLPHRPVRRRPRS
jgi:hypothetical protein